MGKRRGSWRRELKKTEMHARRGIPRNLPLWSISVGSATPSRLGWDKGAVQGYQAYPAKDKGGITHG